MLELNKILNTIICGDCLKVMKQLPDKCVDLCLCDPPYGIGADKMTMGSGRHQWDKDVDEWDNFIPDKKFFDEIMRVSKNQIIWGGELLYRVFTTICSLAYMG